MIAFSLSWAAVIMIIVFCSNAWLERYKEKNAEIRGATNTRLEPIAEIYGVNPSPTIDYGLQMDR
jgi:hypothetical protein